MKSYVKGILRYKTGSVEISVPFPEGRVVCQYCSLFLRWEEAYKRYSCRLTGEWLLYPFDKIGENCPIIFDKKEE